MVSGTAATFDIYFVFMMRQAFIGIPEEISEAAASTAATTSGSTQGFILPLAKPSIVTLILFTFVWSWNDYMGPYIFISSLEKQMLSVGIKLFTEGTVTDPALQMSAATLVLMPVLVLFLFSQKYFVEGVNSSAVKGLGKKKKGIGQRRGASILQDNRQKNGEASVLAVLDCLFFYIYWKAELFSQSDRDHYIGGIFQGPGRNDRNCILFCLWSGAVRQRLLRRPPGAEENGLHRTSGVRSLQPGYGRGESPGLMAAVLVCNGLVQAFICRP